jgi:uncharacterized protein (TIGR03437 family)
VSLLFASFASAQNLRVVNAASLATGSVAPGSIITIFGTNLTNATAHAGNVQNPPVSLGGVGVSIGGTNAALFYVSPTQINAVVDPKTPTGVQALLVTSPSGAQNGSITIDSNAAPGLFSLFGNGMRDGAILNALNFLLGDFSTNTGNSATFLALFATGLNFPVTPVVTIGGVPVQVTFSGPAPCCDGLDQVNVMLPASLAGAGRVPVLLTQNGVASNTVQVVLLPPQGEKEFSGDQDNTTRRRELAGLAWIPGTSLVLLTDENDDVVRVVDVKAMKVTQVISLADGSAPVAVAVTANGATALVAESGTGKVAVIDLTKFMVTTEVATGPGPVRVAIAGAQAVVVNGDNDTVSILNLTNNTVEKTLTVGHGPVGVAIDAAAARAYVLNQDDGSMSILDLAGLSVASTVTLGASLRPESIALTGTGFALITVPSAGPSGEVILLNLATNAQTTFNANPARSGGSSDVVFYNAKLYFANQAGGSVSAVPFNNGSAGSITTIKVDLGARALAVDAKDNLLVVSNEGSGTLVLVNLATNAIAGRISGVKTNDNDDDDHSDHDHSANLPAVQSIAPASAHAGTTLTVTITGTNLGGATAVVFDTLHGNGDNGDDDNDQNKMDTAITVTGIQVSSNGTQLTATVAVGTSAQTGPHVVRVVTPNGESSGMTAKGNTFTVE